MFGLKSFCLKFHVNKTLKRAMVKQQVQALLSASYLYVVLIAHIQEILAHRKNEILHVFKNTRMETMLVVLFRKPKEINKNLVLQEKVRTGICRLQRP